MDLALGWLGKIGDGLLQFVPRREIICTTQAGVVWHFGRYARLVKPGWYVWWPMISELVVVDTILQTEPLPKQTVVRSDGQVIGVSGWVTYKIEDPLKLLLTFAEYQETLRETAAGILAEVVSRSAPDDSYRIIQTRLKNRLKKKLDGSGLKFTDFALSDLVPASRSFALWQAD